MDKLRLLAKRKGIALSDVGFGCWAIGGEFYFFDKYDGWGDIDDAESIKAIQKGYDMGVNFFDTADVYGVGHSETVLGQAVKDFRDKVVIATKFGYTYDEKSKEIIGESVAPEYIDQALKASLKRLNTDYIDIYQLHVGEISNDKIGPMIFKLDQLVNDGLILGYGWSTYNEKIVGNMALEKNAVAIQHSMNLFGGNSTLLNIAETHNLASLNNSPLAMGLLSGKYTASSKISGTDVRNSGFDWVQYFDNGVPKASFLKKLENIREILTADGRTLVQGALGYLLAVSDNNLPIPGFKNVKQAVENAGTLQATKMTKKQVDAIDSILKVK